VNPKVSQWLESAPRPDGVLGCGVLHPDGDKRSRVFFESFVGLETAWPAVKNILALLDSQGIKNELVRLVFEKAQLVITWRSDGVLLFVVAGRSSEEWYHGELRDFIERFHAIPAA
jgi:hypothetical protein